MKPSRIHSLLQDRPAEVQVVLLISSLATIRLVLALIVDLSNSAIKSAEIITDSALLILFVSLLIVAQRKLTFKSVHPLVGVLIIGLLSLNFLQFGGVNGTNCFNYYVAIYAVVMLYSGKQLYMLITFQLLLLALMLYLIFIQHPSFQTVFLHNTTSSIEFIFTLIVVAVFTFYLKKITKSEIKNLKSKIKEVNQKVKESKSLNQSLIAQSNELKAAQQKLQNEVNLRAHAIQNQNQAIEQYIYHNTETLSEPFRQLTGVIHSVQGDTQLHILLRVSNAELTQVIANINHALQSDGKLNRDAVNKKST